MPNQDINISESQEKNQVWVQERIPNYILRDKYCFRKQ